MTLPRKANHYSHSIPHRTRSAEIVATSRSLCNRLIYGLPNGRFYVGAQPNFCSISKQRVGLPHVNLRAAKQFQHQHDDYRHGRADQRAPANSLDVHHGGRS